MKLLALARLPNGIPAGQIFEINPVIGQILLLAGVVKEADNSDSDKPLLTKLKRTYRRRDVRVQD